MNSIFIRIYGGMLLSMLIVTIVSYVFVTQENFHFNEPYPKAMLRGTLYVLGQGLARARGDERLAWYQRAETLFGDHHVKLKSMATVALSRQEMNRLKGGGILVRGSASSSALEGWMRSLTRENLILTIQLDHFTDSHAIGAMKLILHELEAQDPGNWEALIKTYQTHFGTRLNLRPADEAEWQADKWRNLQSGTVVTQLQNGRFGQSTLNVVALTPDGSEILDLGPMNLADMLPYQMFVVYGVVAVVIMGLASYYLVRPLLNRLLRLEETVVKIRRHDLSARVTVDSNDMLGRLAATFNDMAEHIQRLISSQREMTNAVSHELRTPVARIRFGLEFLEDEDIRDARVARIADIDNDIQELERLIDEILTYASLEEGTPSLNLQMIRVDDILSQVKKESD
ncbi:MAG: histidine kinase dimerization/phospho-acceptor domain-containing protein, partial [Gammaproteobacteria bacterium]